MAVSPPVTPKKVAIALPRSRMSNAATTIASAAGNISAANPPWTIRKKIIQASPRSPVGVAPQSADAVAKPITPTMTIVLWPTMSASRPPKANSADSESR